MFRDYVAFEDAVACYEFLADKKKSTPEELRLLTSNFRMYAKLRAETKGDSLAKEWILADESLIGLNPFDKEQKIPKILDKPKSGNVPAALEHHRESIDSMIGLKKTKKQIDALVAYMKVIALRKENNLPTPSLSLHMAFLGNPGTGKTSVARNMAGILHALGLLKSSRIVEVDRSDLIGTKIGQTEERTRDIFEMARGGVLFIDEAHTLLQTHCALDFGRECTDLLCKLMEDYRDEVVVILAGYPAEMQNTILAHKGIRSRINHHIEFPDYTPEETLEIFRAMCRQNAYKPKSKALDKLKAYLKGINVDGCGTNANARDVRNIFEKSLICQAQRVSRSKKLSKEKLQEITAEDIEIPAHTKFGSVIYLKN